MNNFTENPAVVYTAMHGLRPSGARVPPLDAFRAIGAAVASGCAVDRWVIKAGDGLTPLTVVSVADTAGHVTGVYEVYGEIR